jgi:hypothetical protein
VLENKGKMRIFRPKKTKTWNDIVMEEYALWQWYTNPRCQVTICQVSVGLPCGTCFLSSFWQCRIMRWLLGFWKIYAFLLCDVYTVDVILYTHSQIILDARSIWRQNFVLWCLTVVGHQHGLPSCYLSGTFNFEVSDKIFVKFVQSCCNVSELRGML